ncbi:sensor histidine kinase [Sphingomonas sp.]|jgi:two-component sensor histidine kinase|uniref:sensor histidine kinase n=1 Tax=Sphingomonas sp. TaxID=28214 RepID=UPI002E374D64|nr:sensor histidine kinase [Sphingomonas sp.]HEX4694984.1 sensor histidine kinase [Sphingomonas sp.]
MSTSLMARLGELDLPDRLAPAVPRWATQVAVALLCAAGVEIVRAGVNAIVPGSAAFALVFPAIMVATLFARWQAGLLTATISICYTLFIIYLPAAATRTVVNPHLAVFAVGIAALLTIALAETFRRAVNRATRERDSEIADRDLMLTEFEHRVKNNFAIVAGMLDIQRRRTGDPAAAEALGAAMMRVDSIARAHRHLYRDGQGSEVNVRDYLEDLCGALSDALLLRGGVTLDCDADAATIQRDHAVSIGLVLNELVTNAAKHAFEGRERGSIHVSWKRRDDGWRLTVADDGVGMPPGKKPARRDGGLGQRLIEAFAKQAGGTLSTVSDANGTQVTMDLPD